MAALPTTSAPISPPSLLNRELGTLEFNRRVLAQAADPNIPLLERLRFLCIVSSNLDEFFEVRVAGIKEQIKLNMLASGEARSPRELMHAIAEEAHGLVADQYRLLNDEILPALAEQNIRFLLRAEFTEAQQAWVRDYFF